MNKFNVLFLLLGGAFMMLSNGKFLIAPAAWVFPVLFLIAIEKMSFRQIAFVLPIVMAVSNQLSFHGMIPDIGIPMFGYIPAAAGSLYALPFLIQKWSFLKTRSFVATLILPCAYALLDYSNVYFNPFGTFGVLGYSQHQFLPILQAASVVGVTGVTFLIMWTASIVYWLLLEGNKTKKRKVAFLSGVIFLSIVTWGGVRVVADDTTETVTVTGIHTLDRTNEEVLEMYKMHEKGDREFLTKTEHNIEELIQMTITEAQAGAKIIHHAEGIAVVDESQKAHYLERLSKVAQKWGVYIVTVPYVFTEEGLPNENVLYIIDASGQVALEHFKYGGNIIEKTVAGDKRVRHVDTGYGRISGIICWDKDFPSIVNQVGKQKVDILFIPSADWKEISPYHTIVGNVRGVENGANVVTQTVNGMSMISDTKGQTLAQMDHFTTEHWVMRGQVPTEGKRTVYSIIGKYVVGFVILLFILSILSIRINSRKKRG